MNIVLLNNFEDCRRFLERFLVCPRAEGLFPTTLDFYGVLDLLDVDLTEDEEAKLDDDDDDDADLNAVLLDIIMQPGRSKLTRVALPAVAVWAIADDEDRLGKTSWRVLDIQAMPEIALDRVIAEHDAVADKWEAECREFEELRRQFQNRE